MNKESNIYLAWMVISFLFAGIIEGYFDFEGSDASTASITHTVLLMFLIWGWCKMHAMGNNIGNEAGYFLFAALFPVFGLPVYFLKFFGLKKGIIMILKTIGFSCGLIVCYFIPVIYL
ncbi:MAG: hypothetical protein ACPHLK_05285 [Gammaproteobacteria bacterium]|jgi:hypothetical protein